MAENTDVVIYSCELAANRSGQAFPLWLEPIVNESQGARVVLAVAGAISPSRLETDRP